MRAARASGVAVDTYSPEIVLIPGQLTDRQRNLLAGLVEVLPRVAIATVTNTKAVGDMPNDLSMLEWAGHSYAVANAHPRVLSAAGTLLPANDADGVAGLIRRLLEP